MCRNAIMTHSVETPPTNFHVLITVAVALAILLILALRSSQLKHAASQLRYLPYACQQCSLLCIVLFNLYAAQ